MTNAEIIATIRQKIERVIKEYATKKTTDSREKAVYGGILFELTQLFQFVDDLETQINLDSISVDAPDGLDEAAEGYADLCEYTWVGSDGIRRAFKAGAEWAFEQGVTINGSITKILHDCWLDIDHEEDRKLSVFGNEEEVIVQIRSK